MATLGDHALKHFLEWSTDSEVELIGKFVSAGGVHANLAIECRMSGKPTKFLLRMMPQPHSFDFARKEVNPYDLQTEYEVLRDLQACRLPVPSVWRLDNDAQFLGTPAYLMEFVEGPTVLEVAQTGNNQIDRRFAETLVEMNRIPPEQVPSLIKRKGPPPRQPSDLVRWIDGQWGKIKFPKEFSDSLRYLHSDVPVERPHPAFGNGDLNPMNFICRPDGRITIVDWEYAGFNDPIAEIMLLHTWPEDAPFLAAHPIDKIYCELTGTSTSVLKWYEVLSAISGWIYAANDRNSGRMALHERQLRGFRAN